MSLDKVKLLNLPEKGDERGSLIVIEENKDISFDIKRLFYMYGSNDGITRGQHANKNSEFILINVAGSSKVKVDDGKGNTKEYVLDKPNKGLYIPKMIWKDMYDFSKDSVLLVLSNQYYDENEYIRDYEQFKKEVN